MASRVVATATTRKCGASERSTSGRPLGPVITDLVPFCCRERWPGGTEKTCGSIGGRDCQMLLLHQSLRLTVLGRPPGGAHSRIDVKAPRAFGVTFVFEAIFSMTAYPIWLGAAARARGLRNTKRQRSSDWQVATRWYRNDQQRHCTCERSQDSSE
jgi:hypothetical protein